MSFQAINWAYEQDVSIKLKFLLVTMANYADESHSCFPSQKLLAKMTSQSERTVRDQIQQLKEAGLVVVQERRDPITMRRLSDRYLLLVDGPPATSTSTVADAPRRQETSTYRQAAAGIEEPPVRTISDIHTPRASDFDQAWEAWPKKVDKKLSEMRFKQAIRKIPVAELVAEIRRHGEAYALHREKEFTPSLATWLHRERWTDELVGPERARSPLAAAAPMPADRARSIIEMGRALDESIPTVHPTMEIAQ